MKALTLQTRYRFKRSERRDTMCNDRSDSGGGTHEETLHQDQAPTTRESHTADSRRPGHSFHNTHTRTSFSKSIDVLHTTISKQSYMVP